MSAAQPKSIEHWAATTPDATAFIEGDRRLTWAELNDVANRVAHGLAARGVVAGERSGLGGREAGLERGDVGHPDQLVELIEGESGDGLRCGELAQEDEARLDRARRREQRRERAEHDPELEFS